MHTAATVIDPLGDKVFLPSGLFDISKSIEKWSADEIHDIVRKPAFILEKKDAASRYYYRSLGWDTAILVEASRTDGIFTAVRSDVNPKQSEIMEIMNNARIVYSGKPEP